MMSSGADPIEPTSGTGLSKYIANGTAFNLFCPWTGKCGRAMRQFLDTPKIVVILIHTRARARSGFRRGLALSYFQPGLNQPPSAPLAHGVSPQTLPRQTLAATLVHG